MRPNPITPPKIKPLAQGALEVITTHMNADFDAVASMLAAAKLYPNAVMVFPGSQEKNLRNFFIQSVMYLFNVARIKDINMAAVERLIVVDTRQAGRIGPLSRILKNKGLIIHIYDHHPDDPDDLRGEVEVVDQIGANATILTEILAAREMSLSPEEATVLIAGIHEDTGSFTFRSTTPRDYMAAAYLLEQGADLNIVSEMISRELTVEQVALLHELINSAQTHAIRGVEVVMTQATTEKYVDELAVLVHKMMDMENINVMFALAAMEGRIYLVARSRAPQVDVGEIAKVFGGGGHPSAAAATIKNMTLPQVTNQLLEVLTMVLGPVHMARDIMAYPVISIDPDGSLTAARKLLVRYDINVLLVTSKEGAVLGYISMQNVEKALLHGLTSYPVKEFMTVEFEVIGPEATFPEIRAVIIEQKQRILPVVEDGRALGVITRTDLLNILVSEIKLPGSLIEETTDLKTGRTKKILHLIRERLPKNIVKLLADIGRTADRLDYGAYAVGGFVRDLFLRQENLDIDVVIEGDAIKFAQRFAKDHQGVRVRQHRKFNTAVLILPDGFKVDVTTARLEYYESPAALPVVQSGSIRMDLYRRDFTINTLAINLNEARFGTVIDYFRGLKDLKDGYIRVLHNLSFVDDPTRVFRAIRFEQRFDFKIGKLTATLIQNAAKHDFFLKLSGKRLSGEIKLILHEEDPGPALGRIAELDLLKFIHPHLTYDKRRKDLFRRIKKVLDWFDLTYLSEKYEPWMVYFQGFLDGLNQQETAEVCRRLRLLKRERLILVDEKPLVNEALGRFYRKRNVRPSDVYELLHPISTESLLFMMARTKRESTTKAVSSYFTKLKHIQPELTGKDLIALGLKPGPEFKGIFRALQDGRLNGEINSRAEEEDFVRRRFIAPAA
ncbi:MAG: CBS domain-containing protein [Thermodesulfobacteriota bacterium]|nr:CBS domain-containing protein [Thermodesulfobacteriota bacterium]